jgi:hypothetical protein
VSEDRPAPPAPDRPPRQPYEKPAVSWEDDLGTRPGLIAACNKAVPLSACDSGSLQS